MKSKAAPNTVVFRGYHASGQLNYERAFSLVQTPEAMGLWGDAQFLRSHRIARLDADLFDEEGCWDRHYERHFDGDGFYMGGVITYADGRRLACQTCTLEPGSILHGGVVFAVHYVQNTSNPKAAAWFALTQVVYDHLRRIVPSDHVQIPEGQCPPAIWGRGSTHLEAYRDLRDVLTRHETGTLSR